MAETHTLSDFQTKFRTEELLVLRNDAWTWSVRPAQPTLGSGVLSLNRHALRMSDVSEKEMGQLHDATARIESALKEAFNHQIVNYLALMMVDHHVHFHVIPRYDSTRDFASRQWLDNGWPAVPVLGDSQHKDDPELLGRIRDQLRGALR